MRHVPLVFRGHRLPPISGVRIASKKTDVANGSVELESLHPGEGKVICQLPVESCWVGLSASNRRCPAMARCDGVPSLSTASVPDVDNRPSLMKTQLLAIWSHIAMRFVTVKQSSMARAFVVVCKFVALVPDFYRSSRRHVPIESALHLRSEFDALGSFGGLIGGQHGSMTRTMLDAPVLNIIPGAVCSCCQARGR